MKASIKWLAGALLFASAAAQGGVKYQLTDLGTFGGTESHAKAINNNGQVVGGAALADGSTHAFVYTAGTMVDLSTLGGSSSAAFGINDSGAIVGWANDAANHMQAFVYQGGTMSALPTFPASTYSLAFAINASGQITGEANSPAYMGTQAFIYSNGATTRVPFAVGLSGSGVAINSSGTVVGSVGSATVLDGGGVPFQYIGPASISYPQMQPNVTLPGEATAINDFGVVVGNTDTNSRFGPHAFLWQNGVVSLLGGPGFQPTKALGINNLGDIVGENFMGHAFLYSDGVLTDLNGLIDPSLGWVIQDAIDINDRGQIVGDGVDATGQIHAFLLTPTPEPAMLLPLVASSIGWLLRRPRRSRVK